MKIDIDEVGQDLVDFYGKCREDGNLVCDITTRKRMVADEKTIGFVRKAADEKITREISRVMREYPDDVIHMRRFEHIEAVRNGLGEIEIDITYMLYNDMRFTLLD